MKVLALVQALWPSCRRIDSQPDFPFPQIHTLRPSYCKVPSPP